MQNQLQAVRHAYRCGASARGKWHLEQSYHVYAQQPGNKARRSLPYRKYVLGSFLSERADERHG